VQTPLLPGPVHTNKTLGKMADEFLLQLIKESGRTHRDSERIFPNICNPKQDGACAGLLSITNESLESGG
jgi:hypothetical protein